MALFEFVQKKTNNQSFFILLHRHGIDPDVPCTYFGCIFAMVILLWIRRMSHTPCHGSSMQQYEPEKPNNYNQQ